MTIAQLTAFWNANCQLVNRTAIKKFTDKAQGIKRCNELADFMRKAAEKAQPKAAKPAKESKPQRANARVTVSGRCQQLILKGKSNADIWPIIKEQFNLDES